MNIFFVFSEQKDIKKKRKDGLVMDPSMIDIISIGIPFVWMIASSWLMMTDEVEISHDRIEQRRNEKESRIGSYGFALGLVADVVFIILLLIFPKKTDVFLKPFFASLIGIVIGLVTSGRI